MPKHLTKRTLKTGKSRWVTTFPTGKDANGKTIYQCKTFAKKGEAVEWLDKLKEERRSWGVVRETQGTVTGILDNYIADADLAASTRASYNEIVRLYIEDELGDRRANTVRPKDVQSLYTALRGRGLSPTTIGYVHSILHAAFDHAISQGELRVNPTTKTMRPKKEKPKILYLEGDELAEFRNQASSTRYGALFELALATGMRPGELLGLQWSAVNLKRNEIHVRQSLERIGPDWRLKEPKTEESRRTITIPPQTTAMLTIHKATQAKERLKRGPKWPDHGLVFTNVAGEPLDGRNLKHRHLKPLLKKTADELYPEEDAEKDVEIADKRKGLLSCNLYSLRHSHATKLIEKGINMKAVSERLGHKDVGFTMQTYVHFTETMESQATDAIAEVLYE